MVLLSVVSSSECSKQGYFPVAFTLCQCGINETRVNPSRIEELTRSGLVMGILESVQYELGEATLEPGDMLALFSDGVTEASTASGEEFGDKGLARFLEAQKEKPCAEILNELVGHVRDWCGTVSFADDFTIVLLRRHNT